jgi:hypothetical protein
VVALGVGKSGFNTHPSPSVDCCGRADRNRCTGLCRTVSPPPETSTPYKELDYEEPDESSRDHFLRPVSPSPYYR